MFFCVQLIRSFLIVLKLLTMYIIYLSKNKRNNFEVLKKRGLESKKTLNCWALLYCLRVYLKQNLVAWNTVTVFDNKSLQVSNLRVPSKSFWISRCNTHWHVTMRILFIHKHQLMDAPLQPRPEMRERISSRPEEEGCGTKRSELRDLLACQ